MNCNIITRITRIRRRIRKKQHGQHRTHKEQFEQHVRNTPMTLQKNRGGALCLLRRSVKIEAAALSVRLEPRHHCSMHECSFWETPFEFKTPLVYLKFKLNLRSILALAEEKGKPSDMQTFRHVDMQECRHADM